MRASTLNAGVVALCLALGFGAPAAADPSFNLAAFGTVGLSENAAQDIFAGYEDTRAPGLETARAISLSPVPEQELYGAYGVDTVSFDGFEPAPLNEFAGQRSRFEPGVLGEALGKAKNALLRGFGQR